jgi:hypothetical protein
LFCTALRSSPTNESTFFLSPAYSSPMITLGAPLPLHSVIAKKKCVGSICCNSVFLLPISSPAGTSPFGRARNACTSGS